MMIEDKNIMKTGLITITKYRAYKKIWTATLQAIGTSEKQIYWYNQTRPEIIEINGELIRKDRWDKTVGFENIINCEELKQYIIPVSLIMDNMDWITRSLCNRTKTMEYNNIYGGYSKGCYELHIEIIDNVLEGLK